MPRLAFEPMPHAVPIDITQHSGALGNDIDLEAGPIPSVNHELDWLRDIYRLVDPRFNRVTRGGLERSLTGLDLEHLIFVRDLNSAILRDQLEIIGGCPESYEQISLYTDYIVVDNFLIGLMSEAGANAVDETSTIPHNGSPSHEHAEPSTGFTWNVRRHAIDEAARIGALQRLKRVASKPWRWLVESFGRDTMADAEV